MALWRSPLPVPLHCLFASGGIQTWIEVPPQFELIKPTGTPSASWISRPVSQQTALNSFHAVPPRTAAEAAVQLWYVVVSWLSGVLLTVPWPTVKSRMSPYCGASAAAISAVMLFMPAIERGVYAMLLCSVRHTHGEGEGEQRDTRA